MGPLLLIFTTFIWGTAFLAQKIGADSLGPFALTCYRNLLGGLFLLGCLWIRNRSSGGKPSRAGGTTCGSVIAGVYCGVPLFAAMVAQQIGIESTTPGISAFLTTNYILFVPLMAAALSRRLPRWYVVVGASVALVGTYFICMNGETMSVGRGEAWTVLCALLFSVQMMVVDHYAPKRDVLVMSAVQLLVCFLIGIPFLFLPSEAARLHPVFFIHGSSLSFLPPASALLPLVYLGVFSSGIAYTLQNFGQARTPASLAAILLSLESVFGALSGYLVLGDVMTVQQFAGCALVFSAALFVSLVRK